MEDRPLASRDHPLFPDIHEPWVGAGTEGVENRG